MIAFAYVQFDKLRSTGLQHDRPLPSGGGREEVWGPGRP